LFYCAFSPSTSNFISSCHYSNGSKFESSFFDFSLSPLSKSSDLLVGGIRIGSISSSAVLNSTCAEVVQIVKGSVCVDDFTVSIQYSVKDSAGRHQCSFGSAGTVTMSIGDEISVFYGPVLCTTSSFPNGVCIYSGTDRSHFTGQFLTSTVTVSNEGTIVSSKETVYFHAAPAIYFGR